MLWYCFDFKQRSAYIEFVIKNFFNMLNRISKSFLLLPQISKLYYAPIIQIKRNFGILDSVKEKFTNKLEDSSKRKGGKTP